MAAETIALGTRRVTAGSTPPYRQKARAITERARAALIAELETWPKPGLVSLVDTGSHDDMNADTFRRSAMAITPYFRTLAMVGEDDVAMARLRHIGLAAERAMMAATNGVNTHRGAIFALGLLCAAAGGLGDDRGACDLAHAVQRRWGRAILGGPILADSHGAAASRRYGVGGARTEAAAGFPSALHVGLPALRYGLSLAPGDAEAQRVQCFFALLAHVEDTNLLHRGGADGLAFARTTAARFLDRGGVGQPEWRRDAEAAHRAFVARRLSPGGSADLLAVTLFLDASERGS